MAVFLSSLARYHFAMSGPRVGAFSITDKEGKHYIVCSACQGKGCPACGKSGLISTRRPHSSFLPGTLAPSPVSGHLNRIPQATLSDRERTLQVDIDGDGIVPARS